MRSACVVLERRRSRCASSSRLARDSLARTMLKQRAMRPEETWTIPLHIIMWTVLGVGLIMAMAVVMMH
jgi:hypothetical protein